MHQPLRTVCRNVAVTALGLSISSQAWSFAYVFAGEANGIDIVTHSQGYTGAGGVVSIDVGILTTSPNAADMLIPTANVVRTWNNLISTSNNIDFGANVPGGFFDYESVLLHEVGHSLGLGHINAANESGLAGNNRNYTVATDGANNTFDINAGADGVIGSADDIRGDDVNLNYFRTATNNPFAVDAIVDSTTYSRDLADLPGGDTFSANADRSVATLLGEGNTEGVMQQGTVAGEAQRTLGADDVAGLRYAQSGLDEIQGTGDDYTVILNFIGLTTDTNTDILIQFDNVASFAASSSGGSFLAADHAVITTNDISFNTGFNWFFNDIPNDAVPAAPISALAGLGIFALFLQRRRRAGRINTA